MSQSSRVEKAVLPNGLTIVVERMPYLPSVTAGLWIKRGSRHESPVMAGASHFVEHMVFKGTASRSYSDISRTFDRMGAVLDAFTSREIMGFYFGVMKENFDNAFEVLADILLNPTFPEDELNKERDVILEEIGMLNDSPVDLLGDHFMSTAFSGHPLGRPIAGTVECVRSMTRKRLKRHFSSLMKPANLVFTATGDTNLKEVRKRVESAFGRLKGEKPTNPKPPKFTSGVDLFGKRNLEQAQIILAFDSEPAGSPTRHIVAVLANALGGTMSSSLFTEIRERQGLVYSIGAEHSGYTDAGFLLVNAASSHAKARKTITETVKVLKNIVDSGLSEDEITIAKENLMGSQILSMESPSARMGLLIRNEVFFGKQKDPMKYVDMVKKVTPEQVNKMARHVFRSDSGLLCVLGRKSAVPSNPLAPLEGLQ